MYNGKKKQATIPRNQDFTISPFDSSRPTGPQYDVTAWPTSPKYLW